MRKNKNNKKNMKNMTDDRNQIKIPEYSPLQELRPKDYQVPEIVTAFRTEAEKKLGEFLDSTNPDAFNGTYAKALIWKLYKQGYSDIDRQHMAHQDTLNDLFLKYDCEEKRLQQVKSRRICDLSDIEGELAKLRKIMFRGTALEEADITSCPE